MERIAAGDESGLTALYQALGSRVLGLALRIVGDRELAEEIVVDTFTLVWQRARTFSAARGDGCAWVLKIARHRAIDRRRQLNRRPEASHEEIADLAQHLFARSQTAEDEQMAMERVARVRAAAAALPRGQREALAAAFFAGMTHQETAAALAVPLGTVKSRIRDGLFALRRALAPAVEEPR